MKTILAVILLILFCAGVYSQAGAENINIAKNKKANIRQVQGCYLKSIKEDSLRVSTTNTRRLILKKANVKKRLGLIDKKGNRQVFALAFNKHKQVRQFRLVAYNKNNRNSGKYTVFFPSRCLT